MTETLAKYNVTFYDGFCNKNITLPVVYSDDYLNNELLDLNLARLCCSLCSASYDEQSIKQAFNDCGFSQIRTYYGGNVENSASLCIAKRENNIFVVIRGTQGNEWYNNFKTGTSDTHQGYLQTVQNLLPLLKEYIKSNCRLLFTGHSRGGALSNLLAAGLINQGRDGVFAYTFASPNVTTDDDVYNKKFHNIYNFVYDDDFITHCPPSEWGYGRYGNTVNFRKNEINYPKLKKAFNELTGKDFLPFFECKQSVAQFIDTAIKLAASPEEYYNKGYLVDEEYLTLYDYFNIVCDIFTDNNGIDAGLKLLATNLSEFAPISDFLSSGIDVTQLLEQGNTQNSCAMFAHYCLTYLSLLNTQKIKVP
ncbi:MAG: lipase family protein [Ruminococcus sp.]|nr:lipase family protein [Ruminococcus sp.]